MWCVLFDVSCLMVVVGWLVVVVVVCCSSCVVVRCMFSGSRLMLRVVVCVFCL